MVAKKTEYNMKSLGKKGIRRLSRFIKTVRIPKRGVRLLLWILAGLVLSSGFRLTPIVWAGQQEEIDSLRKLVEQPGEDSGRVAALNDLSWKLKYQEPGKAMEFCKKALALAKKKDIKVEIGRGYKNKGVLFWIKGEYGEALNHFLKALEVYKKIEFNEGVANVNLNIGVIYFQQGIYEEALKYYFNALKSFDKLQRKQGIAVAYNNIGKVYDDQGSYEKALDYYRKSLKIKEKIGDRGGIAMAYNNIGNVYDVLGKYKEVKKERPQDSVALKEAIKMNQKALDNYFQSLTIYKKLGNKRGISRARLNIGIIYSEQEEFKKAEANFKKAYQMQNSIGDKNSLLYTLNSFGHLYKEQNKGHKAIERFNESIAIGKKIGGKQELHNAYEGISEAYALIGNYEKAYQYKSKQLAFRDTLFNAEKSKDIGKLEAKYEIEKKLAAKRRREKRQARLAEIRQKRSNRIQYSGIFIFLIFIFVGIFLSGRFTIPKRVAEGIIFFSFILLFEFILVLVDPTIDEISNQEPWIKLVANAILALGIFPLHSFFEERLKSRVVREAS